LTNIATVLKEEITRLSRRELRVETDGLKKSAGQYRSDIAALKKRVHVLEQQLKAITKFLSKTAPAVSVEVKRSRYSPRNLAAQRQRLDLSAADAGVLINVSAQTVYNWESGKTRPSPEQIAAISAMRRLGKRDARAIIDRALASK
jgi:DNA-binding transcriptional regulator YiaG